MWGFEGHPCDTGPMERALGLLIGLIVGGAVLAVVVVLFGGAVVSAVTAVLLFPLAFPLTTAAVVLAIGGMVLWHKVRKRRR